MIQDDMLLVDSDQRKACGVISKKLNKMYRRCLFDEEYAAKKAPWEFKRFSSSTPITFRLKGESVNAASVVSKGPGHGTCELAKRREGVVQKEQAETKALVGPKQRSSTKQKSKPKQSSSPKQRRRARGRSSATFDPSSPW
jgi:hypothetical protein